MAWVRGQKLAAGDLLPDPKELSRRLSLPLDHVQAGIAWLVRRDTVSLVGTQHFAGSWPLISAPDFPRSTALRHALGEYYSLREEFPGRSPLLSCATIRHASLKEPRLHTHDFCELVIVREGAAVHVHEGAQYPVYTGDFFAVLPGQKHAYSHGQGVVVANVMFMPEEIRQYAPQLAAMAGYQAVFGAGPEQPSPGKHHLELSSLSQANALVDRTQTALASGEQGNWLEAFTYLVQLLLLVSRVAGRAGDATSSDAAEQSTGQQTVGRVIAFLQENFTRDLSLADIARPACLSVSRLQHVFREVTGLPLYEYLIGLRISEACRLLAATTTPLGRLSASLGFRKQSYFSELFKARTGVTPSAYRRQHAVKAKTLEID